jgi:hypothetical protein
MYDFSHLQAGLHSKRTKSKYDGMKCVLFCDESFYFYFFPVYFLLLIFLFFK